MSVLNLALKVNPLIHSISAFHAEPRSSDRGLRYWEEETILDRQELMGDIYFQQGNRELAFQAYAKAKESTEEPSEDLQMKYYDLLPK